MSSCCGFKWAQLLTLSTTFILLLSFNYCVWRRSNGLLKPISSRRVLRYPGDNVQELKWAIFTPPKPFATNRHQLLALRSWLQLSIVPRIYLVTAGDSDTKEFESLRQEYGVEVISGTTNKEGLLVQDSIFERASLEVGVDAVVVINSDIVLQDDFVEALSSVSKAFDRYLMIGARVDGLKPLDTEGSNMTVYDGALHTYGGSDFFAWRPSATRPSEAALGGRMAPFTFGRGKADMWIVDMAIKYGKVQVVDATAAVEAFHPKHSYTWSSPDEGNDQPGRRLTAIDVMDLPNHWGDPKSGGRQADFNKFLAFTYGSHSNGDGSTLHAPWGLARCYHPSLAQPYMCLQKRLRPAVCPCGHHTYHPLTVEEIETRDDLIICGKEPLTRIHLLPHHMALPLLIDQKAKDGTIIVLTLTEGDLDLLSSTAEHFESWAVSNYVIAAAGSSAYEYCRLRAFPCFPLEPLSTVEHPSDHEVKAATAQAMLHMVQQGYNVLWSRLGYVWSGHPMEYVQQYTGGGPGGPAPDLLFHARDDFMLMASTPNMKERGVDAILRDPRSRRLPLQQIICGYRAPGSTQCSGYNRLQVKVVE